VLFIVYSLFSEKYIDENLGLPEYSYYFVLKKFLPLLEKMGEVVVVEDPAREVDKLYFEAKSREKPCVYLSFTAPQNTVIGLACPTVAVFAWEFDSVPSEIFDDDKRSDWTYVFKHIDGIITHSNFAVRTLRSALEENYPLVSAPAPVWDKFNTLYVTDSEPYISQSVRFRIDAPVLDTNEIDLSLVEQHLLPGLIHTGQNCEALSRSGEPKIPEKQASPDSLWSVSKACFSAWLADVARLFPLLIFKKPNNEQKIQQAQSEVRTAVYYEALSDNLSDQNPRTAGLGHVLRGFFNRGVDDLELQGVVYTAIFNPHDGRKNWHDMVSAFCCSLRDCEDAVLVIKLVHRDSENMLKDLIHQLYQLTPFKCRVVVIDGNLDESTYQSLVRATSFIVNTSYCEGQCLPLMEYMSAGKPAIAPRNTGMEDYINEDVAFVVDCSREYAYFPQDRRKALRTRQYRTNWESLCTAYRDSYQVARHEPDVYRAMASSAVEKLESHCSMEVAGARLNSFIQSLELQERITANQSQRGSSGAGDKVQHKSIADGESTAYRDAILAGWFNKERKEICRGFSIEADDVVLDVGCGNEAVTLFCADIGSRLLFSGSNREKMVALVKRVQRSTPSSFRAFLTDHNPMPLQSGSASKILLLNVLENHEDPLSLLKEAVRVGRPGAKYLLAVPDAKAELLARACAPVDYEEHQSRRNIFTAADFEHLVATAGLSVESREYCGFYWNLWSCFASLVGDGERPSESWPNFTDGAELDHPLLSSWARTWDMMLGSAEADKLHKALDQALPKTQLIIAVKESD